MGKKTNDENKQIADETKEIFDALPEEVQELLLKTAKESKSEEEFISKIFVGPCPQCGSENTRDLSETHLEDPTIGTCLNCHNMWCLVCGCTFSKNQEECGHWYICEECDSIDDDKEECTIEEYRMEPYLCPIIQNWVERGD